MNTKNTVGGKKSTHFIQNRFQPSAWHLSMRLQAIYERTTVHVMNGITFIGTLEKPQDFESIYNQ